TGSTFQPYTLQANFSTGLTASSFFKWMKNGNVVAQGTNMTSFTITGPNPFGTYWVEVTDVNGCLVKSNTVSVIQDCGSTTGCTVTPSPNLSVTASLSSCNTINTQVTFTTAPSSIVWKLNGNVVPGTGATNSMTTTLAGVNVVQVEATYGSCVLISTAQVIKPYQPKLKYVIGCGGVNPSAYTLTAHNISSLFGVSANAVTYSYQLTGGGQPPQNGSGQSATFSGLTPGQTYQLTLTLTSPGLLPCSITESITLPAMPDMNFTLSPDPTGGTVCSESVITVNIPGYDPANTYYIGFSGTGVFATTGQQKITINSTQSTSISLTVTTPLNCEFIQSTTLFTVQKAVFSGVLTPQDGYTICETSTIQPTITFIPDPLSGNPQSYIWMNGDQPVPGAPNTQSFTPTQSGNYWPILIDSNGCETHIMASQAVPVTIKPVPYANIAGKANLCRGQGTTLYGIVTEPNLEYQWTLLYNGTTTALHPWSTATPTQIPTGTLNTAGTYTYTFHVRRTADPGCGTSVSFTITVSQPQDYPDIGMHIQCPDPMSSTPYSVELTIQNPQAGQYNWSNGQSGTTITVYHGGLYQVTHTAPSGCIVSSEIMVPHDLESLMWIFPTGCYDVCLGDRYIVGPIGDYNNHEWQYFGNSQQDGPGFIYPFWPQQAGNYQLMIDNGYCQFTSGTATLNPDPSKCKIRYECRIELHIEAIEPQEGGYYLLYGIIHNFGSTSVTFTITSMNGYGVYLPNTITIPAGGSYDFYANPLVFYPANGFSGGNDAIVFTAINCEVIHELDFSAMRGIKNPPVKTVLPSFTMSPNPARSMVTVRYNTGHPEAKASMLLVHDAMGNVKFRKDLKSAEGEVQFDTSGWLQGVYIVTVVAPDKPLQGKLLKE
ncbi:T9SS C-terminal target domain-containing protein, partial [Chryseobacterium lacus]